jgi:hypothetical protein
MRTTLTVGLAILMLSASNGAGAMIAPHPDLRPDTITKAQWGAPPWAACRRWDSRFQRCLDPGWGRHRHWRTWQGRRSCNFRGHGWWIDNRGRWRRC